MCNNYYRVTVNIMDIRQRALEHTLNANFYEFKINEKEWEILLPHPDTYDKEHITKTFAQIVQQIERFIGYHIHIDTRHHTLFAQNDEPFTSIEIEEVNDTRILYLFDFKYDRIDTNIIVYVKGIPRAIRKMLDIRDIRNLETHLPWELLSR